MNSNPVLCSNLSELVKKLLLTFCEVNVHFDRHLDIYGSIHIRADDQDVVSMLLNEHCVKSNAPPPTDSLVDIQVSDHHGNPSGKESYKATSVVSNTSHYTKVIHSNSSGDTSTRNTASSAHGSSMLQQAPPVPQAPQTPRSCHVPQMTPNPFASPMFLDMCGNNLPPGPPPPPMADPYRFMGYIQTPVTPDLRNTPQELKGGGGGGGGAPPNMQEMMSQEAFNAPQGNFFMGPPHPLEAAADCSTNNDSGYAQNGNTTAETSHLPEDERTTDETHNEMSATESSRAQQPSTDYESDMTGSQQGVSPWQHDITEDTTQTPPPAPALTPADSDSDSNHNRDMQGGVTYRCRICRKTFSDLKVYSHHVTMCKCQCKLCAKTFSSKQALEVHIQETHNNNSEMSKASSTGRQRYSCTLCEQQFKSRSALNCHMNFRHRKQQLQQKPYS